MNIYNVLNRVQLSAPGLPWYLSDLGSVGFCLFYAPYTVTKRNLKYSCFFEKIISQQKLGYKTLFKGETNQ